MKKSGLADSPFFVSPPKEDELVIVEPDLGKIPVDNQASNKKPSEKVVETKIKKQKEPRPEQPSNRDTTTPRYHDTMTPRIHGVIVELIRKAVKEFGKEAATHRFTQTEKKEISDLIYTYKNQGVKTSENEITRIAVNFVMEDYRENGENSVLHKILKALNE